MTDVELKGLFDAMRQDIGAIRADTTALREDNATIRADIGALRVDNATIHADIGALRADNATIHADIGALRADNATIHADIGALREDNSSIRSDNVSIRGEIVSAHAETRHHFDIVAETMRKEIRLVAEGVMTVDEKLERTAADLNEKIDETQRMIRFSNEQLRRRVSALEEK